jgi:hypothetical protein
MTRANNNVYEPEFRIVLVILQIIGAAVGLIPFGYSVDHGDSYYVSIVLFAFVTFALIMGATATGTYIVDAHNNMAVEAFLCITLFKNFVSFGMTLQVFNFLLNVGNTKVHPRNCESDVDVLYSWRCADWSVLGEYTDVCIWEVFTDVFCKA